MPHSVTINHFIPVFNLEAEMPCAYTCNVPTFQYFDGKEGKQHTKKIAFEAKQANVYW